MASGPGTPAPGWSSRRLNGPGRSTSALHDHRRSDRRRAPLGPATGRPDPDPHRRRDYDRPRLRRRAPLDGQHPRRDRRHARLHAPPVRDDRCIGLIHGSFNWTRGAARNFEDVHVTTSRSVVAAYATEFERLSTRSPRGRDGRAPPRSACAAEMGTSPSRAGPPRGALSKRRPVLASAPSPADPSSGRRRGSHPRENLNPASRAATREHWPCRGGGSSGCGGPTG